MIEMKIFLIFLALGLGNTENLERTYLPPFGSIYPGGSLNATKLPLNFTTEFTETSTQKFITYDESKTRLNYDTQTKSIESILDPFLSTKDHITPTTKLYEELSDSENFNAVPSSTHSNVLSTTSQFINRFQILEQGPGSNNNNESGQGDFKVTLETNRKKNLSDIENNVPTTYIQNNYLNTDIHLQKNSTYDKVKEKYMNSLFPGLNNTLSSVALGPGYQIQGKGLIRKPVNDSKSKNTFLLLDEVNNSTERSTENSTLKIPDTIMDSNVSINDIVYNQVTGNKECKGFHPRRPQGEIARTATIRNNKNAVNPDNYTYSFDSSNGIHVDQSGIAINGVKVQGSYSYIGDDGKLYKVTYSANDNGFQPMGDHLPTSPPIPKAILKVIEQAAKDKEVGIFDDGSYDENKYVYKNYQRDYNRNKTIIKNTFIINGADIPEKQIQENKKSKFKLYNEDPENYKPVHSVIIFDSKKLSPTHVAINYIPEITHLSNNFNKTNNIPFKTTLEKGYFYSQALNNFYLPNNENIFSKLKENKQESETFTTLESEVEEPKLFVTSNDSRDHGNSERDNMKFDTEPLPKLISVKSYPPTYGSNSNFDQEIEIYATTSNIQYPMETLKTVTFEDESQTTPLTTISLNSLDISEATDVTVRNTQYIINRPFESFGRTFSSTNILGESEISSTVLKPTLYRLYQETSKVKFSILNLFSQKSSFQMQRSLDKSEIIDGHETSIQKI